MDLTSLTPLAGGWSGETFVADVAGERSVVRIYARPSHRGDAAHEVDAALLHLVRGLVPVPEVLEVRRADPASDLPALLVTSYLPGERADLLLPLLDDRRRADLGTRLGALLAGADEAVQQRLHDYGLNLGYAFQIADDVLDYTSDAGTLGKNLGDDLAEGKATLPLIHAIGHSDAQVRDALRAAIEHGDTSALPQVLAAIHATGGLEYSRERARGYADLAERAIDGLDDNDYLAALRGLAQYAVNRDH